MKILIKLFRTAALVQLCALLGMTVALARTPTSTELEITPNPVMMGQEIEATITVTASGRAYPTGHFCFIHNGRRCRYGVQRLVNGEGSKTLVAGPPGINTVVAQYEGDSNTQPSLSLPVEYVVHGVQARLVPNSPTIGLPVTVTATVFGNNPTGTVSLYDGSTIIGNVVLTNGIATFTTTFNTAGTHNLKFEYSGDSNNVPMTTNQSVAVYSPPTVSVAATPDNATAPAAITLNATANAVSGAMHYVEFFNGGTLLGKVIQAPYVFNWTDVPAGEHVVTAKATNSVSRSSVSAPVIVQVNAGSNPTSTELTVAPRSSLEGQPVTATVTVTGSNLTGYVCLRRDSEPACLKMLQLMEGNASTTLPAEALGAHTLVASYSGDADNQASMSSIANYAVHGMRMSWHPVNPSIEHAATVTVKVFGNNPTGTVTLKNGSTTIGSVALSGGQALFTPTFSTLGVHELTAEYGGDSNNAAMTTSANVEVVSPPTVSMTVTPNDAIEREKIVLNAAATAGSGTLKMVEFFNGTSKLGTSFLAPYAIDWYDTVPGEYTVTAKATNSYGVSTTSAPITIRVKPNVTVSLTATPNNIPAPATITLHATAAAINDTIAKVEFYSGGKLLCMVTQAPYVFDWTGVAAGDYSVIARATDNLGNSAITTPITVRVKPEERINPTVSMTATPDNAVAPAAIMLNATASDADGTVSKVEFFNGETLLGTVPDAPYLFNWTNVLAGEYAITAKVTDNRGNSTISASVTVSVKAHPTVSLTATPNNATPPATITLSATAADADGTVTQVEFFNGATLLGTVTEAPYVFNWTNVPAGEYTITAKATDNQGNSTVSTAVTVTVKPKQAQMYYIQPDHLSTPRVITDSGNNIVWEWDNSDPFGNNVPTASEGFEFNLRFPGQYFERETNLHYNYHRDYDPSVGRYVQSDPIGLEGGINTYAYVDGNPVSKTDMLGLWSVTVGGYLGVGGEVTFGNDNGNGFITGRVGFGIGGGISYDPNGGIPGPAIQEPSQGGIVLSDSAQIGFSAGPISASIEKGIARNYSNNQSSTYGGPSASFNDSFRGIKASVSIGAQCTIYSGRR